MAYQRKTDNPKMGRPTKAPRTSDVRVRLSEAERDMLEECVRLSGRTKTDIIVRGITLARAEIMRSR